MTADTALTTSTLEQVSSKTLSGHVGHLNAEQEAKLVEFKTELEAKGYYTPARDGKDASHEDVELLRFLRARKFDVPGAYEQMTSAEDWRKENKIAELYDTFPLSEFADAAALYPQFTGRRDNAGLPVYVFKVGALDSKKTDAYVKAGEKRLEERMIALYEHMIQFVIPLCSAVPHAHQETPISGCATIVDISNVSLRRFWQLKNHMQRASTLASARYAETLGAIYLVGAPSFFSTVFGWVKSWFDAGTVEKIHILPSSPATVLSILQQHMPLSSIPTAYGGTLDWSYGAPGPKLDDGIRTTIELGEGEEAPVGPVRWERKGGVGRLRVVGEGRDEYVGREADAGVEALAEGVEKTTI